MHFSSAFSSAALPPSRTRVAFTLVELLVVICHYRDFGRAHPSRAGSFPKVATICSQVVADVGGRGGCCSRQCSG
jgi:hypothetical protein